MIRLYLCNWLHSLNPIWSPYPSGREPQCAPARRPVAANFAREKSSLKSGETTDEILVSRCSARSGYDEAMSTAVMIQDSFLASAYELPKEITKKVFKALRTLLRDPRGGGLRIEKLSGRAAHLWSARVDDD
jgi:hypothetical protein